MISTFQAPFLRTCNDYSTKGAFSHKSVTPRKKWQNLRRVALKMCATFVRYVLKMRIKSLPIRKNLHLKWVLMNVCNVRWKNQSNLPTSTLVFTDTTIHTTRLLMKRHFNDIGKKWAFIRAWQQQQQVISSTFTWKIQSWNVGAAPIKKADELKTFAQPSHLRNFPSRKSFQIFSLTWLLELNLSK